MNMEPLREFVSLETRKRELDAELKTTKQRLDELEEIIIPMFIEAGVPGMDVKAEGATTRYLSIYQDVYASPLNDRGEVVDALALFAPKLCHCASSNVPWWTSPAISARPATSASPPRPRS